MVQQLNHYEFINAQTGNIICHLSVPVNTPDNKELEKKTTDQACRTRHG